MTLRTALTSLFIAVMFAYVLLFLFVVVEEQETTNFLSVFLVFFALALIYLVFKVIGEKS